MTDRVELRLRGRMLEKFVDRALHEGVRFHEVERTGEKEMRLTASGQEAARIIQLAQEYRMDIAVISEAGRPRWRRRFRERWTLIPGLALGLLLLIAFTSCIWRVEATSLDGATKEDALRAIEAHVRMLGAGPGALRGEIDRDALAMDVQAQWPELTHVSVRLSGVYLRIEVAQEAAAPELYQASVGRDLVASRDAVIVDVEPLAGKANVKPGDTVRRGQVLIRGEERIDTELTRGIRALGQVTGRVWFTAECELPLQETVRTRTGRKQISAEIRLGAWRIELSGEADYPCQEIENEFLPIGGLYLPIRIVRTIHWEAEEKTVPMNREQLLAQGEAWALELARAKLPNGAAESACWVDFTENDGIMTAKATVEAQMDIACDRTELTGGFDE